MSAGWTLCLDFGTSNTAASFRKDDGRPEPVQLTDDSSQMPSAVLVTDNGIRVGLEAVRMARLSPEGFEESPKSRLGEGAVWLAGREVEVVDLVGAVMRHAALRAQRMAGGAVPHTVLLTHPIDWAAPRRDALRTAWDRTGLRGPQVRLVPEPVAAVTWFAGQRTVRQGDRVAVLDIGAGTSDVAVLQATGEVREPWRLIAHGGEDDLGGRLIDELLMEWVDRTLVELGREDLRAALVDPANLGARLTARDQTRHAKHALSEWEDSSIPIVVGAQQHTLTLTYDELASLTAPVVVRMTTLLERTLREARVRAEDLDALYLTGGSSLLRNLVGAMGSLVGDRLASLEHPKLVVCLGAHQAADLAVATAPAAAEPEPTRPVPPPVPPEQPETQRVLPPPPPPERPEDRVAGPGGGTGCRRGGGSATTGGGQLAGSPGRGRPRPARRSCCSVASGSPSPDRTTAATPATPRHLAASGPTSTETYSWRLPAGGRLPGALLLRVELHRAGADRGDHRGAGLHHLRRRLPRALPVEQRRRRRARRPAARAGPARRRQPGQRR